MSVAATIPVGTSANAMLLAPDGKTLYVTNGNPDSGNTDTTVTVVNMHTAKVTATISTPVTNPSNPRISSDGKTLLVQSGLNTNQLIRIDTTTNTVTASVQTPKMVYFAASPDARHIVGVFADESGHQVNRIATITSDTMTGDALQFRQLDGAFLIPIVLSSDGTSLYGSLTYTSTSQTHWVRIDTATGSVVEDYGITPKDMALNMGNTFVSPDFATLYLPVSEGSSTDLLLADTATGAVRRRLSVPLAAKYVSATPEGTTILTANGQGTGALTDTSTGKTVTVGKQVCTVWLCTISPDGKVIYAGEGGEMIHLTETDIDTNASSSLTDYPLGNKPLILTHDGTRIAVNQGDSIVLVNTGRTLSTATQNSATPANESTSPPTAIHGDAQPIGWIRNHVALAVCIMVVVCAAGVDLTLTLHHSRRKTLAPRYRHH
jgi:dipeptidyl aminopeptidase/acylaminoacyl peptidase